MILDQHSDYAAHLTPFILKLNSLKNELTLGNQEYIFLFSALQHPKLNSEFSLSVVC